MVISKSSRALEKMKKITAGLMNVTSPSFYYTYPNTDILTPLPALGVDFTIIPGKGPKILNPIRTPDDVALLKPMHDVTLQVPFLGPILQVRRKFPF